MPDPLSASGAASAAGVLTKDVIGWTLTGIGLLINFGFNIWNRFYTDKLARELRQSTFGLEEWKSHRTAITTRLGDFEAAGDRLLSLARGDHAAPALREELNKEGRQLMMAHEALLRALLRAGDGSWEQYGFGSYLAGESDWDRLNSILAEVPDLGDDATEIRASLAPIRGHLRSIAAKVVEQIRVATAEHDPNKL